MKKCLIVINGETYRHGPQGSRGRGTEESFKLQNFASKSHLDFVSYIENKFNLECNFLLFYYSLNDLWDKKFESYYLEKTVFTKKLDSLLGETWLHASLLDNINKNVNYNEYDFILFIRPDLYLKNYFFEIFDLTDNKIKFSNINEITDQEGKSWNVILNHPSVNHQIFYVPKIFYPNLFRGCLWQNHLSYMSCLRCGLSKEQISFFLDTYHSSSTSNTWNPIFHQVGREETKFWVDKDYVVDSDTHNPKKVVYDGRYDNLIKNDFTENYEK
jgi:hypothetical protein